MKLTSFHLNGSRVHLAPIGPGLNVVHCPTGERAAAISDSLRAVLFGAQTQTGWPTPDGQRIGSVDVTDEAGNGRVSRRRLGYASGPLELSLYDGHEEALSARIQQLAATTGEVQIVDFGNGRELSDVAVRACLTRLEAQPDWRDHSGDQQQSWDARRRGLAQRERELLQQRAGLLSDREHVAGEHRRDAATRRHADLLRQRQSLQQQLAAHRHSSDDAADVDSRLSGLDAQVQRIERVIDDVDSRLTELQSRLPPGADDFASLGQSLTELRGLTGALERQLDAITGEARRCPGPSTDDRQRWETESQQLRRTVLELLDSISRQQQSLTMENLRLETKQLQRCRDSLRERLRGLRVQRDLVSLDTTDPSSSTTRDARQALERRLHAVEDELRQWDEPSSRAAAFPIHDAADRDFVSFTDRSDATSAQLAAIDAELETVRRRLEEPRPAPPQDQSLLGAAAMMLSRVSEGELVSLRYDSPTSTLYVADYEGKPHASYDLPLDVQRLVALSLLLSVADPRFPIVLDRVFEETPETATAAILEVLRDACRDGLQILSIVYDRRVADRLQQMQVELRYADWAAPADAPRTPAAVQLYPGATRDPQWHGGPAADVRTGFHGEPPIVTRPATAEPPVRSSTAPIPSSVWDPAAPRSSQGLGCHLDDQSKRIFEDSYRQSVQAEAHSHRHHLDYADSVARIPYFGRDLSDRLEQYGHWTAADFIRGDAAEISQQLQGEYETADIRRWQAQCQLMCGVARLRAFDAKILVACGVTDPLQLQEIDPVHLMRRVQTFVETREGRRLLRTGTPYEISRLQRWIESSRQAPAASDGRTGRYARRAPQAPRKDGQSRRARRQRGEPTRSRDRDGARETKRRRSRSRRSEGRSARLMPNSEPTTAPPIFSANVAAPADGSSENTESATNGQIMKFYLDMNSDVEAAPTIGPKTAELLYEIGIHTVGHLLESTPSEVAEQLDHARISANNVLEWQLQSALVCRVPELRGHDAQILVAVGVTEPEQLAAYEPEDLFAIVAPFVETKAGQRIVRGGKAPDLEEVTEWVQFAQHARQLKAA